MHQKLQMLNVCVNRRRVREGNLSGAMLKSNQHNLESRSEDSDDEFFDCDANNDDDLAGQAYDEWNKPEGRMAKLDGMKLIDSDEYLYVPVTQDPVPKTEDQLEDDAEILLKLGPDSGENGIYFCSHSAVSPQKLLFLISHSDTRKHTLSHHSFVSLLSLCTTFRQNFERKS